MKALLFVAVNGGQVDTLSSLSGAIGPFLSQNNPLVGGFKVLADQPSKTPLQTKYSVQWQRLSPMAVPRMDSTPWSKIHEKELKAVIGPKIPMDPNLIEIGSCQNKSNLYMTHLTTYRTRRI